MTDTTFLLFVAANLAVISAALVMSFKKPKSPYEKMVQDSHTPEEDR